MGIKVVYLLPIEPVIIMLYPRTIIEMTPLLSMRHPCEIVRTI